MGLFRSLVDEGARPRVFRRNATMCSPLRPANQVYLIDHGYAREYTPAGERDAIQDLRGAGELAFWNPAERAKVDALTEVRAWLIDMRRLREHAAAWLAVWLLHLDERYAPASESAPPLSMETPAVRAARRLGGGLADVGVPRHQDPQGAQGACRGAAVVLG
ncbi:hypothetical protein AB0K16_52895 [Nonomuraea jabiensis]|uniref:hypothetical protein n=1 Tax=Nonomuraea jabiensis TaxID=882448 RepID=UPI00343103D1